MVFEAKVKWNGSHYFASQVVRGSKVERRSNGTCRLFDDEPIESFPYYGEGRDEWVEIDESTLKEY